MSHPKETRKCLTVLPDEVWKDLYHLVSKYYFFIRGNIHLIGVTSALKNKEQRFLEMTEVLIHSNSADRLAGRCLRYIRQHSKALYVFNTDHIPLRTLRLKDCQIFRMQIDDLCTYFREKGISVLMEETVKFYAEYVEYFNTKGINIDGDIHLEYTAKDKS